MDPKKPGARDLSDLKAKLGLVKPGAAPAAVPGPGSTSSPAIPAQVPGQMPGSISQTMPAAQAPAAPPPDPRRDPFGAVQAGVQARPIQQIVIADAGPQVHVPEQAKSRAPLIGLIIGGAAVAVLGFWWGIVYRARLLNNVAIEDAQQIKEEVDGIHKKSQPIYVAIVNSMNRTKGDVDLQLIQDLAKIGPLTPPKTDKIFKTNYALLENIAIDRLFNYYNDTIRLYDRVESFVRKWNKDEARAELQKALEKRVGSATTYGVVIDGSGDIPVGMLVEVGAPVCKDPAQQDCGAKDIDGFKIRADVTAKWTDRKARGADAERVIPIKPDTALAEKTLAGGIEVIAAREFRTDFAELFQTSRKIGAVEKDLVADLSKAAARPKVFTF